MVLNCSTVCSLAETASLIAFEVISRGMTTQITAMAAMRASGIGRTRRHARLLRNHLAAEAALAVGAAEIEFIIAGLPSRAAGSLRPTRPTRANGRAGTPRRRPD